MSEEFELTLRVCAQDPEALFRAVAGTRTIGPYELVPAGTSMILDHYFDTHRGRLMNSRFALRLRQEGGSTCLSLKGKERIDARGAIRRLEIEGEWSEGALARVLDAAGITPREKPAFFGDDPARTLSGLGFRVIQCREMKRTRMSIIDTREQTGRVAGEMTLDTVGYRAAGTMFIHYEIEIEAASQDREGVVADLDVLLRERFPRTLCRWDHNKLITGFAVQALAARHPAEHSSPGGVIVPGQWYEEIEDWIGRHRDAMRRTERRR